jgi:hypothetical protein
MEIINSFEEKIKSKNLFYLAKPTYGGWVTFTAHLSKKNDYPIYKITKRTEKNKRDFGYECEYQNVKLIDALKLDNILITAIDKHYWEYIHLFPKDTEIVIHDPTECKITKTGNPLIQQIGSLDPVLPNMKVITIRESVQEYLASNFNISSEFMVHPFYEYSLSDKENIGYNCVSIARIDFDKNTDILLKANQLITKKENHIYLFGAENRIYVHHKLKDLNIEEYWKGKFPKNLSPSYMGKSILRGAKFMVDMSTIKNDGGGTQYTFLEAIYENCILILNNEWISKGSLFKSGINCIGVSDENELSHVINNDIDEDLRNLILKNSKDILKDHM